MLANFSVAAAAPAPTDETTNSLFESISGISSARNYFAAAKYVLLGLPRGTQAASGSGFPARDARSWIPLEFFMFLHLLAGCSNKKAQYRPVIVQFLGLHACLFARFANANANISSVNINIWFTFYSMVFVWVLPHFFSHFSIIFSDILGRCF